MAKHAKKQDGASSSRSQMDGKSARKRNGDDFATATPDPLFDVISVVYHAMQGAETCEQYLGDVSGDHELEELMTDVRSKYEEIVTISKRALAERLQGSKGDSQASYEEKDGEETHDQHGA